MPYKSAKQRAFFHSAGAAKAGLTAADVAEWDAESKGKKLPARAPRKPKAKRHVR